jgi:glycosyltransferase involved in cell wall biosynthesis
VVVGPRGWGDVDLNGTTWLGSVDAATLGGLYELARVVAYVPLAEGWGLPVIEALSAGRPVAASRSTPSASGRADVQVSDPLDIEAIASSLCAALALDDSSSAQQERRDSVKALSWAACAAGHVEVWNCA